MFNYIWPIALVILSNVLYQICAKKVPNSIDPFASLTITYLVGAAASIFMYFILNKKGNLLEEFSKANWAPFVFGLVIVGLEVGWIYVYKAGWQVSIAPIVQSSFVALILILIGFVFYNEPLSWNKIVGVAVCILGMLLINIE